MHKQQDTLASFAEVLADLPPPTPVASHRHTNTDNEPINKTIRVALAGQPNVGKSTIFNLLTGLNQHVGNWPGKTVEQKTGAFAYDDAMFEITDLPGTYSLTANSAEEVIARDFIIEQRPDVVVAIIGAATLERNLYLVAELLPLPSPVVIGLNMMDIAEQEGIHIEPHVLEAALSVRVIPMTATRNKGVQELVDEVYKLALGETAYQPVLPEIRSDHIELLRQIADLIDGHVPAPYPTNWVALKLLEGDTVITEMMSQGVPTQNWIQVRGILRLHDDALVAVASGRYEWIQRLVRAALTRPHAGQVSLTARLDRWATHPLWGLAILAGVLALVFFLTYTLGSPLQSWMDTVLVSGFADLARGWMGDSPAWLSGLIVDGIIGGVGSVLTFLPILLIFFAVMGTLEDTGYMARAAYVMDNFMHAIGLHGKSFLPLFLGFGCSVPAVMGTRIIESRRSRLVTIMLAPLIPCTARLAVLTFLAPAFFGQKAFVVSIGLIVYSLSVMALAAIIINRVVYRAERAGFIMELPLYHLPSWRTIGLLVWQRTIAFVKKAGTLILVVSAIIWLLSYLPNGEISSSYLAILGRWLEPVGSLMGMSWEMAVALLTSFIAKENSIATMGVLYDTAEDGLADVMYGVGAAAGLAFLVVQMLFIPCVATVAAIKQESNSWLWTLANLAFLLVISLGSGILVYQIASRLVL
jgi:ferrous iron transport protein B